MLHVLLVEDDRSLASATAEVLGRDGLTVSTVYTLHEAITVVEAADVVVLDLNLSDATGFDALRALRSDSPHKPILVTNACPGKLDAVVALELGADDYLEKPYSSRELAARIRAVLRRAQRVVSSSSTDDTSVHLGALVLDLRTRSAQLSNEEVVLTPKEFDLLAELLTDTTSVHVRSQLMLKVWGENWWGSTKTLDVHVSTLRKKLGDNRWVESVRGVGFRLVDPAA